MGVPQPLQVGLGDPGPGGRTGRGSAVEIRRLDAAGPRTDVTAGNRTWSAVSVRVVDRAVEGPNSAGPTSRAYAECPEMLGS